MPLVVDCSVTLPWFLEDERSRFTDELLDAIDREEYWAPAIWGLEMLSGLMAAERRRRIDRQWRIESVDKASRLKVHLDSALPDIKAIGTLAERHGLNAYDASYLELAVRRGFALATLDRALAAAGSDEGVAVHSPGRGGVAQRRRRYNI
jgi:predicted nucleic acid-binding protein